MGGRSASLAQGVVGFVMGALFATLLVSRSAVVRLPPRTCVGWTTSGVALGGAALDSVHPRSPAHTHFPGAC